jgi:hypothetical protein
MGNEVVEEDVVVNSKIDWRLQMYCLFTTSLFTQGKLEDMGRGKQRNNFAYIKLHRNRSDSISKT